MVSCEPKEVYCVVVMCVCVVCVCECIVCVCVLLFSGVFLVKSCQDDG